MQSKNEQPYMSVSEKEKYIRTATDFVDAVRLSAVGMDISPEDYERFETIAVEMMVDILKVYEKLMNEAPKDDVAVRHMTFAKDSVQEGLAELVADRQDGMEYETFCKELDDWRSCWREQLKTR